MYDDSDDDDNKYTVKCTKQHQARHLFFAYTLWIFFK